MARKLVVDSSVIVKWVSSQNEKNISQADKILKDAQRGEVEIYTSELAKFEVGNALLKGKALDLPQAYASLGTVYSLPIIFVSETEDLARMSYALGQKLNITYHDASFLAMSKLYNAALITDNPKHQQRTGSIKVIPLARY